MSIAWLNWNDAAILILAAAWTAYQIPWLLPKGK